jgi:DNA repair photolyase
MQLEPRGAAPAQRLRVIRELSGAGIPVAVLVAPVIPAITDREMPKLLEAAAEAGASNAGYVLLRLPYQVKEVFFEWLERRFPQRSKHVESLIRQTHAGELYQSQFKTRQVGQGAFAEQIKQNFAVFSKRFGLDEERSPALSSAQFTRPEVDSAQMGLFT